MLTIGEKINSYCSMCCHEEKDVRAITLFAGNRKDSYNRIFLCESHLKQIAETINFLFEDGEQDGI